MQLAKYISSLNDPRRLLVVVFSVQLSLWGVICLDLLGLKVPMLRSLIGIIYLLFIPGIVLIRVFRLQGLDTVDYILYSMGFSISFLMFFGLFINIILPIFGIHRPITLYSLLLLLSIANLVLCILSYKIYKMDKKYSNFGELYTTNKFAIKLNLRLYFWILFLFIPIFLSIFGAYSISFYNNNIPLLVLLIYISIIPIMVGLDILPKSLYPLTLWIIALSLLFYGSLPAPSMCCMRVTDAMVEYHYANLVITNGIWDYTIPDKLNGMLDVVIVIPIFSIICDIPLTWIFKVLVPFIASFIPVGLFKIYEIQTNSKIAFFSTFFFMSQYIFYTWAGMTAKHTFVGVFLVLLLLLIVNKNISYLNRRLFSIIFGVSLILSHYGTTYIIMFSLIVAYLIHSINFFMNSNNYKSDDILILTPRFVIFFILFSLSWYMFWVGSTSFNTLIGVGREIIDSIISAYILSSNSYSYKVLFKNLSISLQLLKISYIISMLFTIVGILFVFTNNKFKFNFNYEYKLLSLPFLFAIVSEIFGQVSGAITPDRLFHLISFLLSPFCIIGAIFLTKDLTRCVKLFKATYYNKEVKISLSAFISLYLMLFLLINSGFISEVLLKDFPGAPIYISKTRIINHGDLTEKEFLFKNYYFESDIISARWLSKKGDPNSKIYRGCLDPISNPIYGLKIDQKIWHWKSSRVYNLYPHTTLEKGTYIHLGYFNIIERIIVLKPYKQSYDDILPILFIQNKIYCSDYSEIYFITKKYY